MGAPAALARDVHVPSGSSHLAIAIDVLREFPFEELQGDTLLVREPIGVAGLITPWNWPLNQIMCKVAPALATGCTVVLKPSEVAPVLGVRSSPRCWHAAGLPAGVFNLVHGDGPGAGSALSRHPLTSTWCPSPGRPGPVWPWPGTQPPPSSGCTRSWAARAR